MAKVRDKGRCWKRAFAAMGVVFVEKSKIPNEASDEAQFGVLFPWLQKALLNFNWPYHIFFSLLLLLPTIGANRSASDLLSFKRKILL